MSQAKAQPTSQDVEKVGRLSKFADSLSSSMRAVGLGIKERTIIAQRYLKPLPLQYFEHAHLGRAMGRIVSGLYDPMRIRHRENILLGTSKGREMFLETFKEVVKDVFARSVGEHVKKEKIESVVESRFRELGDKMQKNVSTRELLSMVRRTVEKIASDLGVSTKSVKDYRNLVIAYFMNMRVIKGDGKVALVDTMTGRAYVISKSGEAKAITVSELDINKSMSAKGLNPDAVPRSVKEIEGLRLLISSLRNEGFKVKERLLADLRESMIISRAVAEAITTGKDAQVLYGKMLEEDLSSDPEYRRLYHERSFNEIIKSVEAAALANAFMDNFTKLPSRFAATMSRILAAIARYVPVVGAAAAVGGEVAAFYAEYGEQLSDRLRYYKNIVWSLKDLAGERVVENISIPKIVQAHVQTQQGQQVVQSQAFAVGQQAVQTQLSSTLENK